ncbi:growth hormone secretagogue receptor type 1-like [Littorina saxatilis]|uniref:growth hormone secretagogue receptor type 1-like n=1 Tax=Littorina saxatilis TaxID=31220 RepID=UPI0038B672D9
MWKGFRCIDAIFSLSSSPQGEGENRQQFEVNASVNRASRVIILDPGEDFAAVLEVMELENTRPLNSNRTLWMEEYINQSLKDRAAATEVDGAIFVVPEPPQPLLGVATALYVIVFVVGLIGNVAVTFVVLRCRSMRTFINFLFLNLCIADLMVLMISGPTAVVDMYAKEVWYLGKFMCKLIPFLENVVGNASAVTILAISWERYNVACRTVTQSTAGRSTMFKTFMLIWFNSVVAALPVLFITQYTQSTFLDGTTVPVCKTPIHLMWHKVYIVLTTNLFFILPMLAIILLYTKVCLRLISLFKTEQEKLQGYPREIVKLKRQMIQIIVTVVLIFFICHTPYRALVMWGMFVDQRVLESISFESYLALFYMTRVLLYCNHAINPFVYNFVSRKYRRALLWLCCERRRRVRKMEDWRDYANQRPIRHHESNGRAGRVLDADDNLHEMDCINRWSRYQRNDFLVLYENLVLLD